MWMQLFVSAVFASIVLMVPGFFLARALGARWEFSLGIAPILSISLYGILSIVYSVVGIPCGVATLPIPLTLLGIVGMTVRAKKVQQFDLGFEPELEQGFSDRASSFLTPLRIALLLSIVAGVVTATAVYLSSIGDPNNYIQNYDNAWHLSRIHQFAETSNYSSLLGGFYPSAWHGIAALVESTFGFVSTSMAEHATNLAFICVAYPVGSVFLLSVLFPRRPRIVCLGGAFCLAIAFFPWRIMLFGPLYPNLSSFAIMPTAAALFILIFSETITKSRRVRYVVLFVLGGIAMALAQPNAIFSAGVFLIPFCIWRAYTGAKSCFSHSPHAKVYGFALASALLIVFALIWVGLAHAPFMQGVVTYPRESPFTTSKAVKWALNFSFVIRRPQYVGEAVVVLGLLVLLFRKNVRWVTFSHALAVFLFAAAISFSGYPQHLIAGFWYSDYYRLAAAVCVFAIPALAVGLDFLVEIAMKCCRALTRNNESLGRSAGIAVSLIGILAFIVLNDIPVSVLPDKYRSYGFDAVAFELRDMYQGEFNQVLDDEELEFLDQVKSIVGEDEQVLNVPFDGSAFSYSAKNLNVSFSSFGPNNDAELVLLRNELSSIADNDEVREAARNEGIEYVLVLDQDADGRALDPEGSIYLLGYDKNHWMGITALNDETPGFECVLAEDDMRLYRIAQ